MCRATNYLLFYFYLMQKLQKSYSWLHLDRFVQDIMHIRAICRRTVVSWSTKRNKTNYIFILCGNKFHAILMACLTKLIILLTSTTYNDCSQIITKCTKKWQKSLYALCKKYSMLIKRTKISYVSKVNLIRFADYKRAQQHLLGVSHKCFLWNWRIRYCFVCFCWWWC